MSTFTATAAAHLSKNRAACKGQRPHTPTQSPAGRGYVRSGLSLSVQYEADLQKHYPPSLRSIQEFVWRLLVKHGRRCRLLVRAFWMCRQVLSLSCMNTHTHTYTLTCVTHAHAKGLVPSRPLPTQQAGNWGAMPGPAYRDLATALHSLAWSNIHTWPPLPSAGPSERPLICSRDNNVCELWF